MITITYNKLEHVQLKQHMAYQGVVNIGVAKQKCCM